MRSILLIFSLLVFASQAISQFTDNFSDLDFTNSPTWSGDNADFQVTAGAELQLNAPPASATKYLSTPSVAIDNGSWEFMSRIEVNPSGSNYTDVYLVSNTANLAGSLNGYFVRIGGTNDEVALFEQTGTTKTKIIDGVDGLVSLNVNSVKVQVTRTTAGLWELYTDTTTGFTGYSLEGSITDVTHTTSLFSGVSCTFTSTRFDKFFFDDFVVTGTAAADTIAPSLDTIIVTSNSTLDVYFTEPVDVTTSQTLSNYSVDNSVGNPSGATRDASDFTLVHLTFGTAFQTNVFHNLTVSNIQDLAANTLTLQGQQFIYFIPSTPSYREVVINELIADPSPVVGLPNAEFIELYNTTSNKTFNLNGWTISDGSSTATLGNYILLPNSYVIVCSNADLSGFLFQSNKTGVSSLPSLNNSGDELFLKDNFSIDIDYMNFTTDEVYAGTDKGDGGWTIEQVNPLLPCFNVTNWRPSNNNNGGTPGAVNSVYDTMPDTIAPQITSVYVLNNRLLEVSFNESIDTSALYLANMSITGGSISISSYTNIGPNYTSILVNLGPTLDTAVVYTFTLDSLSDCSGNLIKDSLEFVLANLPDSGDLIINEVLFDPFTGGYDFVEVYNNSNKYIDIYGWSISNDSAYGDSILDHYILYPEQYLVLTESPTVVKMDYITHNPNAFLKVDDLPTFSNDEGEVFIYYQNTKYSDYFAYNSDMHFPLLKDVDGVSLERLDFDRETNDAGNWHSAAENIGFATPGLPNSQVNPTNFTGAELGVSPEVFSPDNDGFEDVLNITYELDQAGYVGNLTIYDSEGRKIRALVDNVLLSTEGVFTWDGTTDGLTKARIGTYILFFEIFSANGEVKSIKKTVVLAHKL